MRIGIDARKIADFGIGTYIRGLLTGLTSLGTGDEYVAFAPEGAQLPSGVEQVSVDAPHYSIRELFAVGRAADGARLDLLHAPHYVVPFTRVPLVVTIHDLIHLHQPVRNPLARVYARAMLNRAVRSSRCILTVTEAVRQQLIRELGAKDVIVTPNGVSLPDGAAPSTSAAPRFLYVGNDKPHKNVGALIEAFAGLRGELGEATLVLAGAPFDRFRGRPGVETCGFVSDDELSSLYRSSTALVMPSLEEGFGLPAAEAMAHGIAVITSTDPALVEVTGEAALHVDARDSGALSAAMLRVARDAALRSSLASKGLERAHSLTWKRCAEITRQAYERALKRGTPWNNG